MRHCGISDKILCIMVVVLLSDSDDDYDPHWENTLDKAIIWGPLLRTFQAVRRRREMLMRWYIISRHKLMQRLLKTRALNNSLKRLYRL